MHTQQECTCFDDWKVSDVTFNLKSDSCLHAYFQYFKILLQVSGNELIRRARRRSEFLSHSCRFCFGDAKKSNVVDVRELARPVGCPSVSVRKLSPV